METLYLTIKACYFDEIALGMKTIEYRDITPFFEKRLLKTGTPIKYDAILFQNGYNKNSRRMLVEHEGTTITNCYEINLGRIIKSPYIEVNGICENIAIVQQKVKKQKSLMNSLKTYSM